MADDDFDPELIAELKKAPRRVALEALSEVAIESGAFDVARKAIDELERISLREVSHEIGCNLNDLPDPSAALQSELEAAQRRIVELELAAELLIHSVERWCKCDIEEIENARHKLNELLAKGPSDA
jgi:hypothetical protein